ncbi:MAG TPA: peptidoglycan editing factor PgeF [Syntrophorhabdus sp.]|jgi:hypothetical protein|nr:peptidoglycan editing factor PgeF [Syntrophorhabdus sp.]
MKYEMTKNADWSFFRVPELEEKGIVHGFCTGGTPWDLLSSKIKHDFLDAFLLKDAVVLTQEHGSDVHVVCNGEMPHSGDGLIILEKNVAGIIKTADCLPVILCDALYPMVSIVHAGWRGTVKNIVGKAVLSMVEYGSRTQNIVALLGPSIGSCCYEVKEDVCAVFKKCGFPEHIFLRHSNALFLDLKKANEWVLSGYGINEVYNVNLCTQCNGTLFHSYRRGDTGKRQINFVSIKG